MMTLLALMGQHCTLTGRTLLAVLREIKNVTTQVHALQEGFNKCLVGLQQLQDRLRARNGRESPRLEHRSAKFTALERGGGETITTHRLLTKQVILEIQRNFWNSN